MGGYQYSMWILGNFSSVAEVKANYDKVSLAPTSCRRWASLRRCIFASWTRRAHPSSSSRSTADWSSTTIVRRDHERATFDWMLTNLNNYVGLNR